MLDDIQDDVQTHAQSPLVNSLCDASQQAIHVVIIKHFIVSNHHIYVTLCKTTRKYQITVVKLTIILIK